MDNRFEVVLESINQAVGEKPTPKKKPSLSRAQSRLNAEWERLLKGEYIEYPKVKPL